MEAITETDRGTPRIWQKGYLPPDLNRWNSDVSVHVNRFPLGDIENFCLSRAALAIKDVRRGISYEAAWSTRAPWEKAYIEAVRSVSWKANGDQVSGQDGGFLAPAIWSERWYGLLRSISALDQLPITRIPVPARAGRIGKVVGDITLTQQTENTPLVASSFTFGQVSYHPRKVGTVVNISNELMEDAPESADQFIRSETARAVAIDRDTKALAGNGQAGNPVGLAFNPQVTKYYVPASATAAITTTPGHATPSFYHLSQLRSKVTSLNGSPNVTAGQACCTGMVTHSRFEQTVHFQAGAATAWTDVQGRPLWMGSLNADGDNLLGVKWVLSNVLPVNSTDGGGTASSYIIAGDWSRFLLWECPGLGFDATQDGDAFAKNETQVRIIHRYDAQPVQPEAFAVLAGADQ